MRVRWWISAPIPALVGIPCVARHDECPDGQRGHAILEVFSIRRGGSTHGSHSKDRQQEPCGCLGVKVGADFAVDLPMAHYVRQVIGDRTDRTPRRLGKGWLGDEGGCVGKEHAMKPWCMQVADIRRVHHVSE